MEKGLLGTELCPLNSDVEARTVKVTVFGNGAFREAIQAE